MIAVVDINDVALRLWCENECLHSPGYAFYDGDQYHFGTSAMATRRRTPKSVNTRYWSQLNTQPLSSALGPARHAGDLVHSHLTQLHTLAGQPTELVMCTPGSMTRDQHSLLLGIAEHLPFNVRGLIHRTALLAGASALTRGCHIELQLHQTLVTAFELQDNGIQALDSQALAGHGLLAIQDRLASTIAELFVVQTRFDPLRSADTEQTLYDALPSLLTDLTVQSEAHITINDYSVRVTGDDLAAIGQAFAAQLDPLLRSDWPALLDDSLLPLPGFELPRAVYTISGDAMASVISERVVSYLQTPDELTLRRHVAPVAHSYASGPIVEPTSGPRSDDGDRGGDLAAPVGTSRPTHLLQGMHARALHHGVALSGDTRLHLDGHGVTLTGTIDADLRINNSAAQLGQTLVSGDTVTDGAGLRAQLIIVEN